MKTSILLVLSLVAIFYFHASTAEDSQENNAAFADSADEESNVINFREKRSPEEDAVAKNAAEAEGDNKGDKGGKKGGKGKGGKKWGKGKGGKKWSKGKGGKGKKGGKKDEAEQ